MNIFNINFRSNVILSLLLCSLFAPIMAKSVDNKTDEYSKKNSDGKSQAIGFGTGGLVGALAGGPVGFIVGAAFGAILGDNVDKSKRLISSKTKLAIARDKSRTYQSQLAFEHQQIEQIKVANVNFEKDKQSEIKQKTAQLISQGISIDLLFRTNQSQLEPLSKLRMANLANFLNQFPDLAVELHGYADLRGSKQENIELSKQRNQTVYAQLISQGINQSRIKSTPHGESKAKSKFDDSEGLALDRRVSVHFFTKSNLNTLAQIK